MRWLVLAVPLGLACSEENARSDATGGAAGAAPDAALDAGSGGGLVLDASPPLDVLVPTSCHWLEPSAPDATVAAAEVWCNPGLVNPSACPAERPKPGSLCSDAGLDGLDCKYALDADVIIVTRCDGVWKERGHHCHRQCSSSDAGTLVPWTGKPCGSTGVLQCGTSSWTTQQGLLDSRLRQAAMCCGIGSEGQVTLFLKDGCATGAVGDGQVSECLRGLLEGYRIGCAEGLDCAEAVVTTLQ